MATRVNNQSLMGLMAFQF